MTNRLTKTALAVLLLGTLNATALAPAQAESQDQLPDMGTSAGTATCHRSCISKSPPTAPAIGMPQILSKPSIAYVQN